MLSSLLPSALPLVLLLPATPPNSSHPSHPQPPPPPAEQTKRLSRWESSTSPHLLRSSLGTSHLLPARSLRAASAVNCFLLPAFLFSGKHPRMAFLRQHHHTVHTMLFIMRIHIPSWCTPPPPTPRPLPSDSDTPSRAQPHQSFHPPCSSSDPCSPFQLPPGTPRHPSSSQRS